MLRPILRYGADALHVVAKPVDDFGTDLQTLIDDMIETMEVLLRPWHVSGRSVRPAGRMVAHTGFITTARKCAPGKLLPPEKGVEDSG